MGLRDRLLLYIDSERLTKAEFERLVGLSNDAVSKMTDNTRKSTLDKISNKFPSLNIAWLKTGIGEMTTKGNINITGSNNIANSGIVGGNYTTSVNGGNNEGYILSDEGEDFFIPAGLPKEIYPKINQLIARLKRLEADNEQLRKDKAILQDFVTMLNVNKKQ